MALHSKIYSPKINISCAHIFTKSVEKNHFAKNPLFYFFLFASALSENPTLLWKIVGQCKMKFLRIL